MGRKKIKISKIPDERNRQVTSTACNDNLEAKYNIRQILKSKNHGFFLSGMQEMTPKYKTECF